MLYIDIMLFIWQTIMDKKKHKFGKKSPSLAVRLGIPALVIAVVGGSFFVNWSHFGRSPVAYYGMGAVPMMGMCPTKVDALDKAEAAVQPKVKPTLKKEEKVRQKA